MSFENDSFDTIVDTFGLDYYQNPTQALQEMRRVCRKNGLILLMASGMPEGKYTSKFFKWREPLLLGRYGKFNVREWDKIVPALDFEIIQSKRFQNGSIYLYILRNVKNND